MKKKHKLIIFNQVQFIALGFFLIILAGGFLLSLPISSRTHEWTDPVTALFTATSTSCVTGLAVVDTYTHWSWFGQIIILLLIQIGGLGFITIGVGFSVLFRRQIGLRERDLLKESVNALEIGGIIKLWKNIILGTLLFEAIGAVLLSIRFVPKYGLEGVYYGIFHSISAFCNAGFDLMGRNEQYSSFVSYVSDPIINLTFCGLIILGSLGFIVWRDVIACKFNFKRFSLHTKLVLVVNTILVIGGALLLFLIEKDNTIADFDWPTKIFASLFGSVTTRTAGFNTVDTAALRPASKLLTIILMFIGGSPGSTAGGIKTTTIAVMILYVYSNLRNSSGTNIFHRRISDDVIKKSCMVFCMNLNFAIVASLIIMATSNLAFDDVLFETISAVSTVGMTTGITRDLNLVGRIVIMILMYIGRIGSMTLALSFIQRPSLQPTTYPIEKITIG